MSINNILIRKLIRKAQIYRKNSYSPYSHFMVGASLLGEDNKIYGGCNVENSAFGPSNCAERTAIFKAISEKCTKFQAIAIIGGYEFEKKIVSTYLPPCGMCIQVLKEFCTPDLQIILAKSPNEYRLMKLDDFYIHKDLQTLNPISEC